MRSRGNRKLCIIQICLRVAEERLLCVICQAQEVKSHSGLSVGIHFCFHTQKTNSVFISLIDNVAHTICTSWPIKRNIWLKENYLHRLTNKKNIWLKNYLHSRTIICTGGKRFSSLRTFLLLYQLWGHGQYLSFFNI